MYISERIKKKMFWQNKVLLKRHIGIKTDLMTPQQANLAEMSLYVTLLIYQFTLKMMGLI